MASPELVTCPCCQRMVPEDSINEHLDTECADASRPQSPKRARKGCHSGAFPQASPSFGAAEGAPSPGAGAEATARPLPVIHLSGSEGSGAEAAPEAAVKAAPEAAVKVLRLNGSSDPDAGVAPEPAAPVLRLNVLTPAEFLRLDVLSPDTGASDAAPEAEAPSPGASAFHTPQEPSEAASLGSAPGSPPPEPSEAPATGVAEAAGSVVPAPAVLLHELSGLHARVDWAQTSGATSMLARQVQEWRDLLDGRGAAPEGGDLAGTFALLESQLSGRQRLAAADLERVRAASAGTLASRRNEAEASARGAAGALAAYRALGTPETYEQLSERNRLRTELRSAAEGVASALEAAREVAAEPGKELRTAQEATVGELDNALTRLGGLRGDASRLFEEWRGGVRSGLEAADASLAELRPQVNGLDGFMEQWAMEAKKEAEERKSLHGQQLIKLKEDVGRFVRANATPSPGSAFAKVNEDINAEIQGQEEQCRQEAEQAAFRSRWAGLMEWLRARAAEPRGSPAEAGESCSSSKKRKWSLGLW